MEKDAPAPTRPPRGLPLLVVGVPGVMAGFQALDAVSGVLILGGDAVAGRRCEPGRSLTSGLAAAALSALHRSLARRWFRRGPLPPPP